MGRLTHTDYAGMFRQNMLSIMGADARQRAEALRPRGSAFEAGEDAPLGTIHGYRYIRRSGSAASLGLPGELADALDSEWFMDMTPGFPVGVQTGDHLIFENGDRRRVSLVRGSGGFTGRDIYRLYRLEAV